MKINSLKSSRFLGIAGTFAVTFGSAAQAIQTDADGFNAGTGNTVPTAAASAAFGASNYANYLSLAVGDGNAAANNGFASGYLNYVEYNTSNCAGIGVLNFVENSDGTIALGDSNYFNYQTGSVALGGNNQALFTSSNLGLFNILIGKNNVLTKTSSGTSLVEGTVLIGVDNTSVSTMAWALGKGNIAQTDTVTLGTYATEVSNASLIVGNGTSTSARSNGLVVMRNGTVNVPGSTLNVGGSPAITGSSFNTALASATPPLSSSAWKDAFVPRGAVTSGGLLAVGSGAYATQSGSVAIGNYAYAYGWASLALGSDSSVSPAGTNGTALGGGVVTDEYATALGYGIANGYLSLAAQGASASGDMSIALGGFDSTSSDVNQAIAANSTAVGGVRNLASGYSSFASGFWNNANSAYSVALGSMNRATAGSLTSWVETDSLFELGNGFGSTSPSPSPSALSNAITTLKNGRTTLTNKAWLVNTGHPLDDPGTTSDGDSGGEALVVDGHTRLRGKVIIEEPQGDISMGIYE
jgi:hypothetical protein